MKIDDCGSRKRSQNPAYKSDSLFRFFRGTAAIPAAPGNREGGGDAYIFCGDAFIFCGDAFIFYIDEKKERPVPDFRRNPD